jgi:hypothetical protein
MFTSHTLRTRTDSEILSLFLVTFQRNFKSLIKTYFLQWEYRIFQASSFQTQQGHFILGHSDKGLRVRNTKRFLLYSGALWVSSWLFLTLVIILFDVTAASIILTDFSMEVGEKYIILTGQCHEIFCFLFFSWISLPPAPEYPIRTVTNFFKNLQVKVHNRYQRHRRQICHQYQWHRRQSLPPVSLVLLTPVANLPAVSKVPVANNGNNIRLQIPSSELEGKTLYIC